MHFGSYVQSIATLLDRGHSLPKSFRISYQTILVDKKKTNMNIWGELSL